MVKRAKNNFSRDSFTSIIIIILTSKWSKCHKEHDFPARLRYSFTSILGYLKDSNAAAHSVDTGIRWALIHLLAWDLKESKMTLNVLFTCWKVKKLLSVYRKNSWERYLENGQMVVNSGFPTVNCIGNDSLLAEVSHDDAFLSFLHHRERPLLAGNLKRRWTKCLWIH